MLGYCRDWRVMWVVEMTGRGLAVTGEGPKYWRWQVGIIVEGPALTCWDIAVSGGRHLWWRWLVEDRSGGGPEWWRWLEEDVSGGGDWWMTWVVKVTGGVLAVTGWYHCWMSCTDLLGIAVTGGEPGWWRWLLQVMHWLVEINIWDELQSHQNGLKVLVVGGGNLHEVGPLLPHCFYDGSQHLHRAHRHRLIS